ncbi:MAG: hypothetical protein Q4B30_00580 [Coriobacteriaceae bacterium]|nr:hypothetical protein [Coriobacteriaceae bacterium]
MKLKVCDVFSSRMNSDLRSDLERLGTYYDMFSRLGVVSQVDDSQLNELQALIAKLVLFVNTDERALSFGKRICGAMDGYGRYLDHLRTVLGDDVRSFLVEHYMLATNVVFHVFEGDVFQDKWIKQYECQCLRFFVAIHEKFRTYVTSRKRGRIVALDSMYGAVFVFSNFMNDYPCREHNVLMCSFFDMCSYQLSADVMDARTEQIDADALCNLIDLICSVVGSQHRGQSVTRRIKATRQPRGGFVNPRKMETVNLGDGIEALNLVESTSASVIGMTVDYLTRFMSGTPIQEAFSVSLLGAERAGVKDIAMARLGKIVGLDDASIVNAAHLVTFDAVYRAGVPWMDIDDIDAPTIENIRTMVNRALSFFDKYGPRVLDGFTMDGGYTSTVSSGDGDFLTSDTLWDFKVSKNPPTKDHTLQLLMYWRMGLHSVHPEFKSVRYLGIYNPRLNTVYRVGVDDISADVISSVEHDVIGYD